MAKGKSIPADLLDAYDRIIATLPGVERKGATMPYTSHHGHMFSFITQEGKIALRLPEDARLAFMGKYKAKQCEQHGKVLEEYAEVPDGLLSKTQVVAKYFKASFEYVAALKPKPTTKKKK